MIIVEGMTRNTNLLRFGSGEHRKIEDDAKKSTNFKTHIKQTGIMRYNYVGANN
jgi:hypothetical protein